jgi:hypothetical protein
MIASSFEQGSSMNAKSIRAALRRERLLMCTHEPAGTVYSLDNGVPVSKKLAADLVNPQRLQGDLFLRPNEDGLFPGFTQTWRAEG